MTQADDPVPGPGLGDGPSADVRVRSVWRAPDAAVRNDAIALWRRLGALPAGVDPEARADELCTVAYLDGLLVGVCTVRIHRLEFLRRRFGLFRVLVAPEYRLKGVNRRLRIAAHDALEQWSLDNPAEEVMGMAVVVQSPMLLSRKRPGVFPDRGLTLVGYTADDERVRVAWFDHARVDALGGDAPRAVTAGPNPVLDGPPMLGVTYKTAWRTPDAAIRSDAKALWRKMGVLPEGVDPEARADELCVAAYADGELVGICTAVIERLESVRQRFAMLRMLVAPDHRGQLISRHLTNAAYAVLEPWSRENPDEALMGTGVIIQNAMLQGHPSFGRSRETGLTVIGYTPNGERIRVAWFSHAMV